MAQITKKHLFTFNRAPDTGATVGNNRALCLSSPGYLEFYLHGSSIGQAILEDGEVRFILDPCGWLTTTTCAAMRDFLKACDIVGGVSRAGGKLSGRFKQCGGEFVDMDKIGYCLTFKVPRQWCKL